LFLLIKTIIDFFSQFFEKELSVNLAENVTPQ